MTPDDRSRARDILASSTWLGQREDLIDPVLENGRALSYGEGQWIHAEGDEETGIFAVLDGIVQVYARTGDRDVLINQVFPGGSLGQTTRFGGGLRLVTPVCLTPCRIFQISDRALARIAQTHPHIWEAVSALLYAQLRTLTGLLAEMIALPPRARIARRLEYFACRAPSLRITQDALGEMVGLSRKTTNAHLAALERTGLIQRGYGGVTVIDLDGLHRFVALSR